MGDAPQRSLIPARLWIVVSILVVAWAPVWAGGPRAVYGSGQPMKWDTAGPIVYHPDSGPLGLLDNASARTLLSQAFAEWSTIGVVSFVEGAPLPGDVDAVGVPAGNGNHYLTFWGTDGDGLSPVIFDHDGSIVDAIFGPGARFAILGLSLIDTPLGRCVGGDDDGEACLDDDACAGGGSCAATSALAEASIIINGVFYDGLGPDQNSPTDLASQDELKAVMVHEIGHLLNLDHSVVNHELANDGDTANDIYLPTMYPLKVEGEAALATLNPDDIAALRYVYDTGPVSTQIFGKIFAGGVPFQGAEVILRRTDDPLMTAYSVISGATYFPCNPGAPCDCLVDCPQNPPEQGLYDAKHIDFANYFVCVRQIDTRFSIANDSFVGPLATPPILPGPEECYGGPESTFDDPDDASPVPSQDEGEGYDLQLNDLPASDDFEPNDSLGQAATLDDLPTGTDTAGAYLEAGDLDVYAIPVTAGARVWVDVDGWQLGSQLDPVVAFY